LERAIEHTSRQCAWSGSNFNHIKLIGATKVYPNGIQVIRNNLPKEWANFGRRYEVSSPTRPTIRGIEAVLGVQSTFNKFVESNTGCFDHQNT
jgi:hypothetical protein